VALLLAKEALGLASLVFGYPGVSKSNLSFSSQLDKKQQR